VGLVFHHSRGASKRVQQGFDRRVLRRKLCGQIRDLRDLRVREDRFEERAESGDLRSERVVGGVGGVDVDDRQTGELLDGVDGAVRVVDGAGTGAVAVVDGLSADAGLDVEVVVTHVSTSPMLGMLIFVKACPHS